VADALTAVDALDPAERDESSQSASEYKRRQAFHEALQQKQRGGQEAWEKNESTKSLTMALAHDAVRNHFMLCSDVPPPQGVKIHPSLNDKVEHVVGATLGDIKEQLDEAAKEGKIAHSPSISALSRAMTRRGGRKGLPLRMGVTKKVRC
jgi:hypothetical protein